MRLFTALTFVAICLPRLILGSSPTAVKPADARPSANDHDDNIKARELLPRQGVGAAGGTVGVLPSATQMSPITTYQVHGANGQLVPLPYTQTFNPVPDQWPGPTPGTIGLGTIQGVVGVVKTSNARRSALPEPTGRPLIARGAEAAAAVAEVVVHHAKAILVKRKQTSGMGNVNGNGASGGVIVSRWSVVGAVLIGIVGAL